MLDRYYMFTLTDIEKQDIKARMWKVGNILLRIHNVLWPSPTYIKVGSRSYHVCVLLFISIVRVWSLVLPVYRHPNIPIPHNTNGLYHINTSFSAINRFSKPSREHALNISITSMASS